MTVLSTAPYTLAMLSATPSSLDLVPRTILYTPPSSLTLMPTTKPWQTMTVVFTTPYTLAMLSATPSSLGLMPTTKPWQTMMSTIPTGLVIMSVTTSSIKHQGMVGDHSAPGFVQLGSHAPIQLGPC